MQTGDSAHVTVQQLKRRFNEAAFEVSQSFVFIFISRKVINLHEVPGRLSYITDANRSNCSFYGCLNWDNDGY